MITNVLKKTCLNNLKHTCYAVTLCQIDSITFSRSIGAIMIPSFVMNCWGFHVAICQIVGLREISTINAWVLIRFCSAVYIARLMCIYVWLCMTPSSWKNTQCLGNKHHHHHHHHHRHHYHHHHHHHHQHHHHHHQQQQHHHHHHDHDHHDVCLLCFSCNDCSYLNFKNHTNFQTVCSFQKIPVLLLSSESAKRQLSIAQSRWLRWRHFFAAPTWQFG